MLAGPLLRDAVMLAIALTITVSLSGLAVYSFWLARNVENGSTTISRRIARWSKSAQRQAFFLVGAVAGFAAGLVIGFPAGHFLWPHELPVDERCEGYPQERMRESHEKNGPPAVHGAGYPFRRKTGSRFHVDIGGGDFFRSP